MKSIDLYEEENEWKKTETCSIPGPLSLKYSVGRQRFLED